MDTEINQDNLQKLISMGDKISLADTFNSEFMSEYTHFKTIEELFEKSGYTIETNEDFKAISDDEWDTYITENTSFDSWENMQLKAFEIFTDNILLS